MGSETSNQFRPQAGPEATTAPPLHGAGPAATQILHILAQQFYATVPTELRTYCALTSAIAQAALAEFGIPASLQPCQVWYVTEQQNYVVGFLGRDPTEHKWDGHVVCCAANVLFDAATAQFQTQFGLPAPDVAYSHCFEVPTHVLARMNLRGHDALWWLRPPVGAAQAIPQEPRDLIERHARALAAKVREVLAAAPRA